MAAFTLYLPDALLEELEELRGATSRSGAIRGALLAALTLARLGKDATGLVGGSEPSDHIAAQIREEQADVNATRGAAIRRGAKGLGADAQAPVLSRSELFAKATQRKP
jgi:hypothetical protein